MSARSEPDHRTFARYVTDDAPHEGDCQRTLCSVCGCCRHCDPFDCGCEMATVTTSFELTCPGCDCTGGGE